MKQVLKSAPFVITRYDDGRIRVSCGCCDLVFVEGMEDDFVISGMGDNVIAHLIFCGKKGR